METWGNDPATFEAVGTIVTAAAILFAWLSLRESRAQRRALEAEIAARMRPWVGLFDFGIQRSEDGKAQLRVLLRNFGPLPAQQARLKLLVEPREVRPDEQPQSVPMEEKNDKALMPMEEGRYFIELIPHPQITAWIIAERDVVVNGTFEYAVSDRKLQSQFQGTLWFSRGRLPAAAVTENNNIRAHRKMILWRRRAQSFDSLVPSNWRNTSAT